MLIDSIIRLSTEMSAVKEKEYHYEQEKGIHPNWTFSSNCYYCAVDGVIVTGAGKGQRAGKEGYLS